MNRAPPSGTKGIGRLLPTLALLALASTPALAQTPPEEAPLPWQSRGHFDPVMFMSPASTTHIYLHSERKDLPVFVFFPPTPPVLGTEVPVLPPFVSGPPAPSELDAFVCDLFYPLLAERIAGESLDKPIRSEIVAYHAARTALQSDLRRLLSSLREADAATREKRLREFSSEAEARVREIDAMADRISEKLRPTRVLGLIGPGDEPAERLSRRVRAASTPPTDPDDCVKEARALRAAAYFQEGLSDGQRWLLVEAALECDAKAGHGSGGGQRVVFFSPESSRIPVPENLGPEAETALSDYVAAKKALKDEIKDLLWQTREDTPDARRDALAKLAVEEQSRISAVERRAECLRPVLEGYRRPTAGGTEPSLPPELTERIVEYRRHKLEILKALRSLIASPTAVPTQGSAPAQDVGRNTLAWTHDESTSTEIQSSDLRVSASDFNRRQTELLEGLNREEASIRQSLAAFVKTSDGPSGRKSVNDLLREFEEARLRQELGDEYRDYEWAVYATGLSPELRRILFSSAVQELSLPLPVGERME